MNNFKPAKLSFKKRDFIDSNGNTVSFDDPRVVHVWPMDTGKYVVGLLKSYYKKYGLNFRACGKTDSETLQLAKKITSGRECLPFNSIAGSIYKDIMNSRKEDELTLYYSISPFGPCQNSAWPLVYDTFMERNKLNNVIFNITLDKSTNYFNKGVSFLKDFASVMYLSDLLEEAENSLKCIAENKTQAMDIFTQSTNEILKAAEGGLPLKPAINKWAKDVARIPKRISLKEAPKVLIFGGLNVLFTNHPVVKYFEENGIIAKCVDILEGGLWASSYNSIKYGAKTGNENIEKLFSSISCFTFHLDFILKNMINKIIKTQKPDRDKLKAAGSILNVIYMEIMTKKYRAIMKKSGLLYDKYIPYKQLVAKGGEHISNRVFTESNITVGRYLNSIESNVFDGLINIGTFNCQPAMNSIAVLRSISNEYNVPFISMDCDGGELSSNQLRLLETLSVQAKRYNKTKNS